MGLRFNTHRQPFTHSGQICVILFCIADLQRPRKESCHSPPPRIIPFSPFVCRRPTLILGTCQLLRLHSSPHVTQAVVLFFCGQTWPFHAGKCQPVSSAGEFKTLNCRFQTISLCVTEPLLWHLTERQA